jgi:EmrB/QacA subfamily drug resistance transporter
MTDRTASDADDGDPVVTPPPHDGGLVVSEARGRWVLAATVLGSGLALLDSTVVNLALPAIGRDLGGGVAGLTWTVNAYTLTLAALILLGGSLGDRLGRRRIFLTGVTLFGVASLLCALAPGITLLIVARAVQGVGAALLTPGSLAIIQATFRPEDRSRAIGAWSGLGGVAAAVGPFLGGWLLGVASWRWIFLINLPVVAAVIVIAARHVPETRESAPAHGTDYTGAVLAALGLGALTYGLTAWPGHGATAPSVLVPLVAGILALAGFVWWESLTPHPMLPLNIFSARLFSVTNLVTFPVYAGLGGVFFWLVVTLQVVAGFGPLAAGLALLPVTLLMLMFSSRAGVIGERVGPRVPMSVGPLVAAVGVALLVRVGPDTAYLTGVLVPVTILGLGLTLTVTPLTATALSSAPRERAGLASGVNNAVARTGGLLVVAVLPVLTGLDPSGFADPAALAPAFRSAMLICAALLAAGGLVAAAFIRAPRPVAPPPGETATCPRHHCGVDAPPLARAVRR